MSRTITYTQAVREAAHLFPEWDEWERNPEYVRAMSELVARLFGIPEMDTADRADMVRADMLALLQKEYANVPRT